MRTFTFPAEDRQELAHDRYHHPDPRVQRKREVLWLKSHGLSHDDIATDADVSRRSVQRDLDEYLEGGLPRLRRCPGHHPRSALVEHETSLEEYFQAPPPLHQAGPGEHRAADRRPQGPQPGPPLPQGPVRAALAPGRGHPRPPQEDQRGARPGAGHLRAGGVGATAGAGPAGSAAGGLRARRPLRVRAVPGLFVGAARLFVRAASGRKRDNVLGALDAVTHRLIRVTNHDSINAESVCALVRVVAEASVGLPITLVLDNARYQKCARVPTLAASLGIELLAHGPKSVATLILRIARRTALVASFMLYDHSNMAMYWPRNHLLTPRKLRKKFRAPVHNPSVVLL